MTHSYPTLRRSSVGSPLNGGIMPSHFVSFFASYGNSIRQVIIKSVNDAASLSPVSGTITTCTNYSIQLLETQWVHVLMNEPFQGPANYTVAGPSLDD